MNQGINFYKTYDVIKISQCHESNGATTLTPNSRLDRWKAVHDAITSWLINDANDDLAVKVAEILGKYGTAVDVQGIKSEQDAAREHNDAMKQMGMSGGY